MKVWRVIGALLLLIGAVGLAWQVMSRRRTLPCPSWLAWSLSSRLTEWLAATEETLDWIGLEPGQRVLEIGPGPGRLLIPAARRVLPGGAVVGLDIQAGMIDKLKARAAREDISNLTAVVGDASEAHFPPASFDVVFLCTALGEIQDRAAALAQCYRALKPGGRLSITEIMPDPHYQSRETTRRLAESAGFRPEIVHGGRRRYTANFVRPLSTEYRVES